MVDSSKSPWLYKFEYFLPYFYDYFYLKLNGQEGYDLHLKSTLFFYYLQVWSFIPEELITTPGISS